MESKYKKIIIVVFILSGLMVFTFGFTPVVYKGGWEVGTSIDSINVGGDLYDESNKPLNSYSWGSSYLKFDVDDETFYNPTTSVRTTFPISYISQNGKWVEARDYECNRIIEKKIGDDVYFFYEYVFFFEIGITAEANWQNIWNNIHGEARLMKEAKHDPISVFLEIDAGIWNVLDSISNEDGTATYKNSDVWTGVMSASVESTLAGYVSELPDGFTGVEGGWSVTNVDRLNMFTEEGSEVTDKKIDDFRATPSLIEGVPTKVLIEVAGTELSPGWWWPSGGSIGTYSVKAEYRIRFDVVASALYNFEQGIQEDTLGNISISDPAGKGIFDEWFGLFGGSAGFLSFIINAVIIVLVLYLVIKIGIPVIRRVLGNDED